MGGATSPCKAAIIHKLTTYFIERKTNVGGCGPQ